jgi:FlaA1/EpsC-like NDP-sugar epimerase
MMWRGILLAILTKGPAFLAGRFLRNLRIAADVADLHRVLAWNVLGSAVLFAAAWWWFGPPFPRSVYLIDFLVCLMATTMLRCATPARWHGWKRSAQERKGILIFGAGVAGAMLLREIHGNPSLPYKVVGLLDDDESKHGAHVLGTPVIGSGKNAAAIVARLNRRNTTVEEIVIAIPSATGKQRRQAVSNCQAARIPFKTIPGLGDLLCRKVLVSQIREVSLSDLLGRPPVQIDTASIRSQVEGSRV